MMTETTTPFRLAMRVEGSNWCCYFAKPDTMQDAIFLGSIAMAFIEANKERRDAFIKLMSEAVGDVLEDLVGSKVSGWERKPAPDSERSGNA